MAYLKPQTPLKDLNSGDYFYPLTNLDQIITGNNRLSAFMSEDSSNHNLLNLTNIGNLSVNGTSYFNGDTTHNGILYFANGTKYFINNSAKGYLFDLFVNKVRLCDNWIGFYSGANSTTTRYGYIQADGSWLNICKENGGNILFSGSNVYIRGGKSLYVGDDSAGGMIQCGTYKDTAHGEHQVSVASGAGTMYMYSAAGANGNRGIWGINNAGTNHSVFYLGQDNYVHAGTRWYGAVWNDYAEFRKGQMNSLKPGQVVTENGNGTMKLANQRLQKGCKILSDTYGYALGETTECKLPIAVSGRVLVYCDTPNEELEPGDCLCANYTGNAIKMTQEEIIKYPDRIIGTVSEFPDYEVWHAGDQTDPNGMKEEVKVNGRIWVYVR